MSEVNPCKMDPRAVFHSRVDDQFVINNFVVDVAAAVEILNSKLSVKVDVFEIADDENSLCRGFVKYWKADLDRWFEKYGDTVDLTVPLIIAHVSVVNPGEKTFNDIIPIDGWKRIYKAIRDGVKTLPAVCLSKEESASVIIEEGLVFKKPKIRKSKKG